MQRQMRLTTNRLFPGNTLRRATTMNRIRQLRFIQQTISLLCLKLIKQTNAEAIINVIDIIALSMYIFVFC